LEARKVATSFIAIAAIVAGCGGSSATTSPTGTPTASGSTGPVTVPNVGISDFDAAFTVMSQFIPLTQAGTGMVGVILPDTTTSTRYVDFDAPYLQQAFVRAGYLTSQFKIDNAQGSDATELSLAQADIQAGATVLVMDPLDATVGGQIETLAEQSGVTLISYDRATFQGTSTYYVSFNNVKVGNLIGQGFLDCVTAWGVTSPQVFELDGGENSDPNAIDFAKGYNSVIWGQEATPLNAGTTNSKGMTLVNEMITPDWINATGGTIFQQQFTAHPNINATVEANDGLANVVIQDLKGAGIQAKTIPTTGQDATIQGMENVLTGYQCGSVYKPIYLEAQAAVALATILRAKQTPPASLLNGTTTNADKTVTEPAVLLTPVWVDASNMAATVIKDQFVSASDLCTAVGTDVCSAAGITP
jgi:D-xylose transport system substrate-binding protein